MKKLGAMHSLLNGNGIVAVMHCTCVVIIYVLVNIIEYNDITGHNNYL